MELTGNRTTNKLRGCKENTNHKARTLALIKKKFKTNNIKSSNANNIKTRELLELLVEYVGGF